MLLQIMEEGHLTDSFGRRVDFRNCVLLMTSNIGASMIKSQGSLGFVPHTAEKTYEQMKQQLIKEVDRHFRPEFLNRLDDTIVFRQLTKDDMKEIVVLEFKNVRDRLRERNIDVKISDPAKELIIERGFDPDFGARPIRRAIERFIEDPLSEELLRGQFKSGDTILVQCKDDHLVFKTAKEEPVSVHKQNV